MISDDKIYFEIRNRNVTHMQPAWFDKNPAKCGIIFFESALVVKRKGRIVQMKKVVSLALALVMAMGFAAPAMAATDTAVSDSATVETAAKNTATAIKFPQKTVYVVKGKKVTIPAKGYNSAGKSVKIKYKSSKKSVATVSSKGVVTGKKKGTAKITATGKGVKKAVLTVKVVSAKKKCYGWDKYNIPTEMYVGQVRYASATPYPTNSTGIVVKYSSSDKGVATVDSSGRVTAKKPGSTRITIKVGKNTVYRTLSVGYAPVTKNQQVLSRNGVKIVVNRLEYTMGGGSIKMHYTVTNTTGRPIKVNTSDVVANGRTLNADSYNSYTYIQNDTSASDCIYMGSSNLELNGISKINTLVFKIKATYNSYYTSTDFVAGFPTGNISVTF